MGNHEVDEDTAFAGKVSRRQLHCIDLPLHRDVLGQHSLQTAALQVLADNEGRQQTNPTSAEDGLLQRLVVIDTQGTTDRHGNLPCRPGEPPTPGSPERV